MQNIVNTDFPKDHLYYRTSSKTYRKYMESPKIETFGVGETHQFGWKKKIFGDWFQLIKYERIDTEPDIGWLKSKFSLKHAWVIWIPEKRRDIPKGWKRFLMQTHYVRANVTILQKEYWKKWNERAKRSRKKFLSSGCEIQKVDKLTFIDAFKKTPVRHLFKKDYIEYYSQMYDIDPSSIRSYIVYYKNNPIAGLAVHDFYKSSVHLIAFTNRKYYKLQAGTGLIDKWFQDSLDTGIQYIDFDRLKEPYGPKDQQGYSDFKKNFIEFETSFPSAYFKIF